MTTPTTNYGWTIPANPSSISGLQKISKPIPTPGPTQVVVKLSAASLNFRDLLIAVGGPYPGNHVPGLVLGADGAGTIFLSGSSSSWRGKEGTAVVLHCSSWMSGDIRNLEPSKILGGYDCNGTLQQFILVDDALAIPAPKGLTGVQAASLPTAGATAWSAIRGSLDARFDGVVEPWKGALTDKRLQGQYVLTQGTGGVSCFAIQIASALGATVISTSSSTTKLATAKQLGATHLVNYKTTPDWDQEVLRLTDGKGVDHVIEVGGAATIMKSVNCTRPGGLISVIGILSQADVMPKEFVPAVLFGAKIVKGCTAFTREATAEFCEFVEVNRIQPLVAQTFGFEETREAFEMLQRQNAVGKLVVRISEE